MTKLFAQRGFKLTWHASPCPRQKTKDHPQANWQVCLDTCNKANVQKPNPTHQANRPNAQSALFKPCQTWHTSHTAFDRKTHPSTRRYSGLTYKIENDGVQELNQLDKTPKSTQHTHARTVCHDRGTHAQTHTHTQKNKNTHAHTMQTQMRQTSLTEESQTTIKPLEGGHGGELNGGDHPKRLKSLK